MISIRKFDCLSKMVLQNHLSCRSKATKMSRKPLKKFVPSSRNFEGEETIPLQDTLQDNEDKYEPREKVGKSDEDYLPPDFDRSKIPNFEQIMGWDKSNPTIKHVRKSIEKAKVLNDGRGNRDSILLEGKQLIKETMNSGFYPNLFVFSRLNLLADIPFDMEKNLKMVQIPYKNIKVWSDLSTSPGILGKKCYNVIFYIAPD